METPLAFASRVFTLLFAFLLVGCGGPALTPSQVSEMFFSKCAEGKYAEVYESTTVAFRVEKTVKYFEARFRDIEFGKATKFEWQEPQVKGDVAERWVDITIPKDEKTAASKEEKLSLVMTMHRDGRKWRVHQVNYTDGKIREDIFAMRGRTRDTKNVTSVAFAEPVTREVPTERLIRKMVEKTLLDFNDALRAKDFADFIETVSERWRFRGQSAAEINQDLVNERERITAPQMNTAFKSFIDNKVDISSITKAELKLKEPPRITSDGVLLTQGEFLSKPNRVSFKLEYYFEGGIWKLFGLSVDLNK